MNFRACFWLRFVVSLGFALNSATTSNGAIIGTNIPSQPLTMARISALPADIQLVWKDYLERSLRQRKADQEFLKKEIRDHQVREVLVPKESRGTRSMPLENKPAWYGSAEARALADNIVSYQTPAGGWSKNFDLSVRRRSPGEHFGPGNRSLFTSSTDFDAPIEDDWNYVGTFDNGATTTELNFLVKIITETDQNASQPYRTAFLRGLDYIFAAQYPNGGWPQVWPLQGGYHDAVTLNDGAMVNVLRVLRDVADRSGDLTFVPEEQRRKSAECLKRGLDCLLKLQIVANGRRTIWCQQYDMLTLEPDSARNYEMPSRASGESAGAMLFLMEFPNPSAEIVAAIHSAATWFERTKIENVAFTVSGPGGRRLVSTPGSGPLWARYYDIAEDKPLFGDRDKTIHNQVEDISAERRMGYSWYTDAGKQALQRYAKWKKSHSLTSE